MTDGITGLPASLHNLVMQTLGMETPEGAARRVCEIDQALDLLAALGVQRVVFRLDGGGDEGQAELEEVAYADGRVESELPVVPVGFDTAGRVVTVEERLWSHAEDAPDFDWINNEGGSGSVTYQPMADQDERIDVDMHENSYDDEYEGGDEDDEGHGSHDIVIGDNA